MAWRFVKQRDNFTFILLGGTSENGNSLRTYLYSASAKTFVHNLLDVLIEVKVKLSLCLTKHHAMKMYWGVEVQLHPFLTSALAGDEWSERHAHTVF
jgi:hypothetical protein